MFSASCTGPSQRETVVFSASCTGPLENGPEVFCASFTGPSESGPEMFGAACTSASGRERGGGGGGGVGKDADSFLHRPSERGLDMLRARSVLLRLSISEVCEAESFHQRSVKLTASSTGKRERGLERLIYATVCQLYTQG